MYRPRCHEGDVMCFLRRSFGLFTLLTVIGIASCSRNASAPQSGIPAKSPGYRVSPIESLAKDKEVVKLFSSQIKSVLLRELSAGETDEFKLTQMSNDVDAHYAEHCAAAENYIMGASAADAIAKRRALVACQNDRYKLLEKYGLISASDPRLNPSLEDSAEIEDWILKGDESTIGRDNPLESVGQSIGLQSSPQFAVQSDNGNACSGTSEKFVDSRVPERLCDGKKHLFGTTNLLTLRKMYFPKTADGPEGHCGDTTGVCQEYPVFVHTVVYDRDTFSGNCKNSTNSCKVTEYVSFISDETWEWAISSPSVGTVTVTLTKTPVFPAGTKRVEKKASCDNNTELKDVPPSSGEAITEDVTSEIYPGCETTTTVVEESTTTSGEETTTTFDDSQTTSTTEEQTTSSSGDISTTSTAEQSTTNPDFPPTTMGGDTTSTSFFVTTSTEEFPTTSTTPEATTTTSEVFPTTSTLTDGSTTTIDVGVTSTTEGPTTTSDDVTATTIVLPWGCWAGTEGQFKDLTFKLVSSFSPVWKHEVVDPQSAFFGFLHNSAMKKVPNVADLNPFLSPFRVTSKLTKAGAEAAGFVWTFVMNGVLDRIDVDVSVQVCVYKGDGKYDWVPASATTIVEPFISFVDNPNEVADAYRDVMVQTAQALIVDMNIKKGGAGGAGN